MSNYFGYGKDNRHRVFISYYHKDDEYDRERFEELFGYLFINSSVQPGDIDSDNSDEYIKHLIQEDYISNASVCVVLVGANTYGRKHVDWEISAALNKKVGGYSGLVGICLPDHPDYGKSYNSNNVPARLVDNLQSGYANFYDWTEDADKISRWVENAYQNRISGKDNIDNSRKQLQEDISQ